MSSKRARLNALLLHATVQPASSALLELQVPLSTHSTWHSIFQLLRARGTHLRVYRSTSELSPSTHRRMRRNKTLSILNLVHTQNLLQIQQLEVPGRNYHCAAFYKQQSKIPVCHALGPFLVIYAIAP